MPKVRFDPAKWSTRAGAAGGEYASGTASPRRPWASAAAEAEGNYSAATQAAIAEGRFGKGVSRAGDAKWRKGITDKGRARYQQGVSVAQDEYRAGFAPYASVIEGVTLSPRGPKGTNYGRVQEIGNALMAAKAAKG